MVSAPYERKNGKPMKIAVLAVKACISKSILPTYGRFSRARSHLHIIKITFYAKTNNFVGRIRIQLYGILHI